MPMYELLLCETDKDKESEDEPTEEPDDRTSPEIFEDAVDNAIYPDDEEDD